MKLWENTILDEVKNILMRIIYSIIDGVLDLVLVKY